MSNSEIIFGVHTWLGNTVPADQHVRQCKHIFSAIPFQTWHQEWNHFISLQFNSEYIQGQCFWWLSATAAIWDQVLLYRAFLPDLVWLPQSSAVPHSSCSVSSAVSYSFYSYPSSLYQPGRYGEKEIWKWNLWLNSNYIVILFAHHGWKRTTWC